MPEEIVKALKDIQDFRDMIDGIVQDLSSARDTMDNTLSIFTNPLMLLTADGGKLEQKIKQNNNKAMLHFMMAANKMEALGCKNEKEEEDAKSE